MFLLHPLPWCIAGKSREAACLRTTGEPLESPSSAPSDSGSGRGQATHLGACRSPLRPRPQPPLGEEGFQHSLTP